MSRKNAREIVFKLVFEFLFTHKVNSATLQTVVADEVLTGDDDAYISRVYNGVISKFDELNDVVALYSRGFALDRMIKADLAALLLAIYEMKYEDEIPYNVSISEAVDLVKAYSTDKSGQFINGVLASVYKEMKNGNNN